MIDHGEMQKIFSIYHSSDISVVRRHGLQLSQTLGFDHTTAGKLSLIISEAATNILKHAKEGQMFLTRVVSGETKGIEILALDKGPGISNLPNSLRDGVTTAGTAGTGLGALRRLSDSFDAFSVVGKGSAFYMCLWSGIVERSSITLEIGRIAVPILYEEVCGDGWAVSSSQDSATLLLTDGLGHGVLAAQASQAATQLLAKRPNLQPLAFVEAAHAALRGTRGAALAVAELRFKSEELNFVGIGNISACVIDGLARKQLVSHNGIVGHNMRKVQQFSIPCPAGSLYVMHSDGINTHWDLNDYPGLSLRHPALIAGIIYRDFTRARDDASVLASRFRLHS